MYPRRTSKSTVVGVITKSFVFDLTCRGVVIGEVLKDNEIPIVDLRTGTGQTGHTRPGKDGGVGVEVIRG